MVITPDDFEDVFALTESIKRDLQAASESFLAAGAKLEMAEECGAWELLRRSSWREYCELDLHISDSLAYDLIKLHRLRLQYPDLTPRLIDVGVSKMRLLLPGLGYQRDERKFEVDAAALQARLDDAEAFSWHDLRKRLNEHGRLGATPLPTPGERDGAESGGRAPEVWVACPRCQANLRLSRAAQVIEAHVNAHRPHTIARREKVQPEPGRKAQPEPHRRARPERSRRVSKRSPPVRRPQNPRTQARKRKVAQHDGRATRDRRL